MLKKMNYKILTLSIMLAFTNVSYASLDNKLEQKKERKTVNLEQYKDMLNLIADNEQQKVKEIVLFVADDQIIPLQLNLIEKATDINFIVLLSKEYKDTDVISFFKDLKNVRVKQLDVSITAWSNAQLLRLEDKVIAVAAANGKINDNNIGDFVVPGVLEEFGYKGFEFSKKRYLNKENNKIFTEIPEVERKEVQVNIVKEEVKTIVKEEKTVTNEASGEVTTKIEEKEVVEFKDVEIKKDVIIKEKDNIAKYYETNEFEGWVGDNSYKLITRDNIIVPSFEIIRFASKGISEPMLSYMTGKQVISLPKEFDAYAKRPDIYLMPLQEDKDVYAFASVKEGLELLPKDLPWIDVQAMEKRYYLESQIKEYLNLKYGFKFVDVPFVFIKNKKHSLPVSYLPGIKHGNFLLSAAYDLEDPEQKSWLKRVETVTKNNLNVYGIDLITVSGGNKVLESGSFLRCIAVVTALDDGKQEVIVNDLNKDIKEAEVLFEKEEEKEEVLVTKHKVVKKK